MFENKMKWTGVSILFIACICCGAPKPASKTAESEPPSGQAGTPAETGPTDADGSMREPLRFNWPVPSKVKVVETTENLRIKSTVQYVVSLVPANDGDDLIVHIGADENSDGGVDIQSSESKPEQRLTLNLKWPISGHPDILITKGGNIKSLLDFDVEEYIKQTQAGLHALMSQLAAIDAEKSNIMEEKMKMIFETQGIRWEAEEKFKRRWRRWVERWIGIQLANGETSTTQEPIQIDDKTTISATVSVSNLGLVEGDRDSLKLQTVIAQKGPELLKTINLNTKPLFGMMNETGMVKPEAHNLKPGFKDIELTSEITAILNPRTLQPQIITEKLTQTAVLQDDTKGTNTKTTQYEFKWDQ